MMHRNRQHPIPIAYFIDFIESEDRLAGGTERQLLAVIKHLDKSRYRPILFALRGRFSVDLWNSIDCEKYILGVASLISLKSFRCLLQTAKMLRSRGVILTQTFFFDATVFGVLSSCLAGVPEIVSSRRDLGFWYTDTKLNVLKCINRLTNRIMVNSNAIKKQVALKESVDTKKIKVIYNGIDLSSIDKKASTPLPFNITRYVGESLVVGMVANFNRPIKRVDLFIRAAAIVTQHRHNVCFLVIGGGNLENKLKSMALELGVDSKILFLGPLADPAACMKRFDIGVVPSDSEGFPNVILEYMALSVSVVATDVGGNTELIQHDINGLLVPSNNSAALAAAIEKLLDDHGLRAHMAANARMKVQQEFTWPNQIRKIETFYHDVNGIEPSLNG